jgi:phage/plasmid primase-like uncharacterized protein
MTNISESSATAIIKALGGNTATGMCRCPAHDDRTASLHVGVGHKQPVVVKCHAGCSSDAVIAALKRKGLWSRGGQMQQQREETSDPALDEYKRFRRAFAMLRAGEEAKARQPVAYLKGRGINKVPDNVMMLPPASTEKFLGERSPAMVAPVVKDRKLVGAHTILLSRDGKKRIRGQKRSHGPIKGGCVVLGSIDRGKPLIISESIEDTLSVMQITGLSGIATLGASNMPAVNPPDSSEIIIAADCDMNKAGQKAAEKLAQHLVTKGVPVRIAYPPKGHKDWNDALVSGISTMKMRRMILDSEKIEQGENDSSSRALTTRALSEFEPRDVEWLWYPFVPLREITSIVGDGGVGKSTLALDIAARITNGSSWPQIGDEPKEQAPKGSVLILSKEDDPHSVIRPRLAAAKANVERAHLVGYPGIGTEFDPVERIDTNTRALEREIARINDVRLVVIDPITDFLGAIDAYKEEQVRGLLTPLVRISRRYDLAILTILHLNKKSEAPAKYRGMGSVAFRNVPRSVIHVADNNELPGHRMVIQEKENLAGTKKAAAFTITTARHSPQIKWHSEWQKADVDEVIAGKPPTKQKQAADWLREILEEGPKNASEIREYADATGIGKATLRLAKGQIGVRSEKQSDGHWQWRLP